MLQRKKIKEIAEKYHLYRNSLDELAERVGGYVIYTDDLGMDGVTVSLDFLGVEMEHKYLILIDGERSSYRQRYTLAHEIGHIVLGHIHKKYIIWDSIIQDITHEREANIFAAELLMPEKEVIEKAKTLSLEELSAYFRVSKSSMQIRLKELGIRLPETVCSY